LWIGHASYRENSHGASHLTEIRNAPSAGGCFTRKTSPVASSGRALGKRRVTFIFERRGISAPHRSKRPWALTFCATVSTSLSFPPWNLTKAGCRIGYLRSLRRSSRSTRRTAAGICPADKREGVMNRLFPKNFRLRVTPKLYEDLRQQVLLRDGWRCQSCGAMSNLEVHHKERRSQSGDDSEPNLITLCTACHSSLHRGSNCQITNHRRRQEKRVEQVRLHSLSYVFRTLFVARCI
jgi:hypothetical protein